MHYSLLDIRISNCVIWFKNKSMRIREQNVTLLGRELGIAWLDCGILRSAAHTTRWYCTSCRIFVIVFVDRISPFFFPVQSNLSHGKWQSQIFKTSSSLFFYCTWFCILELTLTVFFSSDTSPCCICLMAWTCPVEPTLERYPLGQELWW